jgi:hypothetical protein
MIEIKDEILYLVIAGFLLQRIHPVFEIYNIEPNRVAALGVGFWVDVSLLKPFPIVHSHRVHGRRYRWCRCW